MVPFPVSDDSRSSTGAFGGYHDGTTARRHDVILLTGPRAGTEGTKDTKTHEDNVPRTPFGSYVALPQR